MLDAVHSYSVGVIVHTQTPTRSNLALLVGVGGDEVEGREIPYIPYGYLACKTQTA